MASEDSDELVPRLPSVHRLGDSDDLEETVHRLMTARRYEFDASRELLEVVTLRAAERMLSEERDHRLQQVHLLTHDVPKQVLAMIVVSTVRDDLSDAKELMQLVETLDALRALGHRELMSYLITELVAGASGPVVLPDETDGEASLSVYEADHPATELDQPFLLVFRTRHVVTMVNVLSDATR